MDKIFISMPMKDLTDEEIIARRNEIAAKLPDCEIIDSFTTDAPKKHIDYPLYYLGRSIIFMSEADKVFFAKGWENARGCKIEHAIAEAYNIPIIEEE